eukprot:gb/GFBE01044102.1/.p1 GENE.gb/GFBE01044102.1/~~gb/GFBE01044102.1/.p1  ORF type:complete len:477 (+),score=81.94 gb/GFBE01044102.1/:1-1431(+)
MANGFRLCTLSALAWAAAGGSTTALAGPGAFAEDFACDAEYCHNNFVQVAVNRAAGRKTHAGQTPTSAPSGPSIYVYEVPSRMVYKGVEVMFRNDTCLETAPIGSQEEVECLFGATVELGESGSDRTHLRFHDVEQWSLGRIFLRSLQRHPRRVSKPEDADLFFIPQFNYLVHTPQDKCPPAELLMQQLPFLNQETAPRHIWLTQTTAWTNCTCMEFNSAASSDASEATAVLAKTTKLALEDRESAPQSAESLNPLDKLIKMAYHGESPPVAENLHSIPYASMLSGLDAETVAAWQEFTAEVQRPFLASALWGVHGITHTFAVRMELMSQCSRSANCSFTDLDAFSSSLGFRDTFSDETMREKSRSTFCLEPIGDTTSRKGLVDSIMAGCIPVLFSPLQAKLWPWHVGRWEDVAIVLEEVPSDVMAVLAKVPDEEIARLRSNLPAVARRLSFSPPGQPRAEDALEITLHGVLATVK